VGVGLDLDDERELPELLADDHRHSVIATALHVAPRARSSSGIPHCEHAHVRSMNAGKCIPLLQSHSIGVCAKEAAKARRTGATPFCKRFGRSFIVLSSTRRP
jgi:hypothetical protein